MCEHWTYWKQQKRQTQNFKKINKKLINIEPREETKKNLKIFRNNRK